MLRSPNAIQLEKNYNSGGVVANELAKDARTAHIALYHDSAHPSVLELPVVARRNLHVGQTIVFWGLPGERSSPYGGLNEVHRTHAEARATSGHTWLQM
jgi:hypothetical protein